MANIIAARRYAKALFSLCREQSAVEPVRGDLDSLVGMMKTSANWHDFILSPVGSHRMRATILNQMFKDKIHAITLRFLLFIDDRRRIGLLPEIYEAWMALYDEANGIQRARVISAIRLDEQQISNLTERLSKRFGSKVQLSAGVDPSMIGGFKIYIGDEVHDYSVSSQLDQLKKRMIYA